MMRLLIATTCVLMLTACSTAAAPTADATPTEEATEAAAPAAEIATYAIPDLDDELGKTLAMAMAEVEGVDAARPDTDEGLFEVTFKPGATDPAAILTAVQAVSVEATLQGVAPVEGGKKKDCGGCPKKHKCPKPAAETAG